MAKKQINVKLDDELLMKLDQLAKKTGKSKTTIISQAIDRIATEDRETHQQIELLNRQNEQLQMMLSATKALISEKDRVIQTKDDLINELRHKKRGFFAKLFGIR